MVTVVKKYFKKFFVLLNRSKLKKNFFDLKWHGKKIANSTNFSKSVNLKKVKVCSQQFISSKVVCFINTFDAES